MAQEYTIATGSDSIEIQGIEQQSKIIAIQVVSDSALDAQIDLSLQQSIDGTEWHDLPEALITADSGANSNLLQTASFYMNKLAVKLDVKTATLGTLTIYNPNVD